MEMASITIRDGFVELWPGTVDDAKASLSVGFALARACACAVPMRHRFSCQALVNMPGAISSAGLLSTAVHAIFVFSFL